MKNIKIPWWDPKLGEKEWDYLKDVFDRNFPNEGPLTTQFEKEIASLLKVKYSLAIPNCTSAMFLCLKAHGIGHGDEVLVPDITFIATANAIAMTGATPVLVDVDKETANISIESLKKNITKKTKAIVPVHVTGRGAQMKPLLEIAKKNDLAVVEDAAEALLSKQDGRFLGTIGNSGCFSFSPNKTITTGQGGMIVTDDEAIYKRLVELKDQGRPKRGTGGDDIHHSIGFNFKFTDIQAAVGLGQLHYLKERVNRLKKNYQIYKKEISNLKGITLYPFSDEEVPQWSDAFVDDRGALDSHLQSNGMDSRRFWLPIHRQAPYKKGDSGFEGSIAVSDHSLWLPSAYTLSDSDVLSVCETIRKFLKSR